MVIIFTAQIIAFYIYQQFAPSGFCSFFLTIRLLRRKKKNIFQKTIHPISYPVFNHFSVLLKRIYFLHYFLNSIVKRWDNKPIFCCLQWDQLCVSIFFRRKLIHLNICTAKEI